MTSIVGWFDVTDPPWNADPSGVHPCNVAINHTLSSIAVTGVGGVLYFPPGTYTLTGLITVPSQVMVRGAGPATTTINQTEPVPMLVTAGTSVTKGVTVRDISLNYVDLDGPNCDCLTVSDATDTRIIDVTMGDYYKGTVIENGSVGVYSARVNQSGGAAAAALSIGFEGDSNSDLHFTRCSSGGGGQYGLYIRHCSDTFLSMYDSEGFSNDLQISPDRTGAMVSNLLLTCGGFDNATYYAAFIQSGNYYGDSIGIQDVRLSSAFFGVASTNVSVEIGAGAAGYVSGVSISGSQVQRASENAINVGVAEHVQIAGNGVYDYNTSNDADGSGIAIAGASGMVAYANIIGQINAGNPKYGIYLDSTCTNVEVVGCNVLPVTPFEATGAFVGTEVHLEKNPGLNPIGLSSPPAVSPSQNTTLAATTVFSSHALGPIRIGPTPPMPPTDALGVAIPANAGVPLGSDLYISGASFVVWNWLTD